jgi:hypothetical protein
MLLIICVDEIGGLGEEQTTRALPPEEWVKDHESVIEHVLGNTQRYQKLLAAVTPDTSMSFQTELITPDDDDYISDDDYFPDEAVG